MKKRKKRSDRVVIGWREWVALPEFDIDAIKAKVDTGARTSALHAYDIEPGRRGGIDIVRFKVHPLQRDFKKTAVCRAPLHEYRRIRSSNGKIQNRPVILTSLTLAEQSVTIELTLTSRDEMGFRMLLGREAIRGRFLVDSARSFVTRKLESSRRLRRKVEKP